MDDASRPRTASLRPGADFKRRQERWRTRGAGRRPSWVATAPRRRRRCGRRLARRSPGDLRTMCGIVGMVTAGRDMAADLVGGIRRLEYRGYDSSGVALLNGKGIVVAKDIGGPSDLVGKRTFEGLHGSTGIAHTRWATHGGVTQKNAHPHLSCDGQVAVVHNGVLSNYRELRAALELRGHSFKSETDTEVFAHLIEEKLKKGVPPRDAVRASVLELEGTYAFAVVIHSQPDRLWALRKESPLVVGFGADRTIIASDPLALASFCPEVLYLDDGEMVEISSDGAKVWKIESGLSVDRARCKLEGDFAVPERGAYPHFMLKEMAEATIAVRTALCSDPNAVTRGAEKLLAAERVFFTGMGTAYHMAIFGHQLVAQWAKRFCPVVTADELPGLVFFEPGDLVIGVSQSGETYDTMRAVRAAKSAGGGTLGIVNVAGSSMARECDQALLQGAGPEIAVLATKSALSQAVVAARLALEAGRLSGGLSKERHAELLAELNGLPALLDEWRPKIERDCQEAAARFLGLEKWFFLGRGLFASIAQEGALKFKEVTYRHAEGMAAGFLKHGTISLIDSEMGTVIFVPPTSAGELRAMTIYALEEVRSRGGPLLAVGALNESDRRHVDAVIGTSGKGELSDAFLQIVAGQYLAYYTARALGRDIDRPRALAKSVTVP
ncbi:MAG: glutamine--fructose-6-phosphate transaminase (isomerizing) [Planctomycetes bacterium]|nr:glutamine--fructose-6-phosphate transaminase (isomerizing) [Planctomycetota bacterium]